MAKNFNDGFKIGVPRGDFGNVQVINKFGRAPQGVQSTSTDIWDRADATPTQSIWTAPTQARVHAIVSADTADVAAGDGARTIQVYGLTSWSTAEVSEVVTMNGTTPVNTTNSYAIIHRMKVLTKGGSGPNVGAIKATAATDSSITAQINAGEGQTQMAIYGIPSTKCLYMTRYYATINRSSAAAATLNVSLLVNPEPDSELTGFLTKNTRGLQSTGNSSDTWKWDPYYKIDGPAIVKINAFASANDVECSAGFDGYIVDKST